MIKKSISVGRRQLTLVLKDSIELKTTPDKIFEWLTNLDKHYGEWHPDHVKCRGVAGSLSEGDTFCFEEYIHGKLHKLRGKITKIEENRVIEYKCLFPMSIICPKGSFVIDRRGERPIFTPLPERYPDVTSGWMNPVRDSSPLE